MSDAGRAPAHANPPSNPKSYLLTCGSRGARHNGRFALDVLRFERADGRTASWRHLSWHLSDTAQALLATVEESGPGDRVLLSGWPGANLRRQRTSREERVLWELPKRQHVPATDWAG
jgi:hypothetical protein